MQIVLSKFAKKFSVSLVDKTEPKAKPEITLGMNKDLWLRVSEVQ